MAVPPGGQRGRSGSSVLTHLEPGGEGAHVASHNHKGKPKGCQRLYPGDNTHRGPPYSVSANTPHHYFEWATSM